MSAEDIPPGSAEPAPSEQPPAGLRAAPRRRAIVIGLIVLATVLLGGYLIGYLLGGGTLPRHAEVAGVPIGGLSRAEAVSTLAAELGPRAAEPIVIAVGPERASVDPSAAGLSVDYEASVDEAGGRRSLSPPAIFRALSGGASTSPVIRVDAAELNRAMSELAGRVNRAPVDAELGYRDGKLVQQRAGLGIALLVGQAPEALRRGYLADGPVELPADLTDAAITDAEADQVRREIAEPAISGPIRITVRNARRVRIEPAMIAAALTFVPSDGTLAPRLDPAALKKAARGVLDGIEQAKPKDATVRMVGGKPKVIPAVDGTELTATALAGAVEPVLTKVGAERTAVVELSGAKARFTTADADKLGVKEVIGQFTTYYPYLRYRDVNIGRAAELINNTLLKPGDTFSLNGVVGERTAANGFVKGYVIQNGKFREELGGGVSQSATTTFNAMFFAGLTDIEHKPHTLYIDRYPAGREATVAWPSLDLKFRNDTRYGVLVQAYRTSGARSGRGSITVRMWSTKTWDKVDSTALARSNFTTGRDLDDDSPKCVPMVPVQGFDVNYQRRFYRDGKVVKRERFFWRYAPTDRVRCT